MAIITIPDEYLPTRKLLAEKYPALELPDRYKGSNENENAAEIFYNSIQQGRSWENIEITEAPVDETLNAALCKFYAPNSNYIIFYGFTSLTGETKLSVNSQINCLYLAHYYGTNSTIIVSASLSSLKKSPIIQMKLDKTVPSYKELENFIEVIRWMKSENITAPLDVMWFVAQNWSPDVLVDTLVQGGSMREITRLLAVGFRDPESIKRQITGEEASLPESWLNDLLDVVGYEGTI